MKRIFKYLLSGEQLILPKGSIILSAIEQYGKLVLYALVNTETKDEERYSIMVYDTGRPITTDINYYCFLNTVSLLNGQIITHVFYKKDD